MGVLIPACVEEFLIILVGNFEFVDEEGVERVMTFGLWYIHDYRRTPAGWRISSLYEKPCYALNVPDWVKALTK